MLPNIVFITCHDVGRHLGCYGVHEVHTPAIDAIAQQGALFEAHFCPAPQCSPSRAALHTGRYPHATGLMGLAHRPFNWRMHPGERHAVQHLKALGYQTTLLGVQHLTPRSADLGYDRVVETLSPRQLREADAQSFFHASDSITLPARKLAANARRFLAESTAQPFYLEIGFFEAHRPYAFGGTPPDEAGGVAVPPYLPDTPAARAELAELQGAIRALDAGVGAVFEGLRETGLLDKTWFIFTTDHGIAMPRAKSTLFEAGIEAALIMHWPSGGMVGGRRIRQLTSHVDILPTMLEALGHPIPPELQGQSFWTALNSGPGRPRDAIFAEKTFHTTYEPMRCIRTTRHKLIVYFEIGLAFDVPGDIRRGRIYPQMIAEMTADKRPVVALYDLEADPLERNNLAGQPAFAALAQDLLRRLWAWMQATDDPLLHGPVTSPHNAEVQARLASCVTE